MPDIDATAIKPFIKLDRYLLVIYKKYRFIYITNEIVAYLREKYISIDVKERQGVVKKVYLTLGII